MNIRQDPNYYTRWAQLSFSRMVTENCSGCCSGCTAPFPRRAGPPRHFVVSFPCRAGRVPAAYSAHSFGVPQQRASPPHSESREVTVRGDTPATNASIPHSRMTRLTVQSSP